MDTSRIEALERQRDDLRDRAMVLGERNASLLRKVASRIQQKITRLKKRVAHTAVKRSSECSNNTRP